nr:hypothetical protein [Cronobacter dublinensis]
MAGALRLPALQHIKNDKTPVPHRAGKRSAPAFERHRCGAKDDRNVIRCRSQPLSLWISRCSKAASLQIPGSLHQ